MGLSYDYPKVRHTLEKGHKQLAYGARATLYADWHLDATLREVGSDPCPCDVLTIGGVPTRVLP